MNIRNKMIFLPLYLKIYKRIFKNYIYRLFYCINPYYYELITD